MTGKKIYRGIAFLSLLAFFPGAISKRLKRPAFHRPFRRTDQADSRRNPILHRQPCIPIWGEPDSRAAIIRTIGIQRLMISTFILFAGPGYTVWIVIMITPYGLFRMKKNKDQTEKITDAFTSNKDLSGMDLQNDWLHYSLGRNLECYRINTKTLEKKVLVTLERLKAGE